MNLAPSRDSSSKSLVVIIVEGLGTSLVGTYGANTARTPAIDRCAARGVVLDNCFLDSTSLEKQLSSLWTGRHAMQQVQDSEPPGTLWSQLAESNIDACLITDCEKVAAHGERLGCVDVSYTEPVINTAACADNADCGLSGVFASAAEVLASGRTGLIWIHSRGLKLPWDAPLELRRRFADPEDPEPPVEVGPPEIELSGDSDPDIVTGWGQVAAAQASVVDQAVAALHEIVADRSDMNDISWLLGSLGGVALGESQYIGFRHHAAHSEQLRLVSVLSPGPESLASGVRISVGRRHAELFQLPDLYPSLLELLGEQLPSDIPVWGISCLGQPLECNPAKWPRSHQVAMCSTDNWQWLRCPAWSAVLAEGLTTHLFVKPDDRWEVTDVSNRRISVTEQIDVCHKDFMSALKNSNRGGWAELPDDLTNLIR